MLEIVSLQLEDFGPFKGRQSVRLSLEDGVTIIYGENMRGKTSLLNAIRFAFFGRVIGRGAKATSLHKIGNWEQMAVGKYGFEVRLDFRHDKSDYSLTRTCRCRTNVGTPSDDDDYKVDYFLKRNGAVLGPQQGEAELQRILPEQISRFFLFDGELLQEYEDLLSNESDMGRRISEAIERILGVPVLTSARSTLGHLKEKAEQREALEAQGDQKTREFGNQLTDLQEQRKVHAIELERMESDLDDSRSKKLLLEEAMKKKERVAALLDKRDNLDRLVKQLDLRKQSKESELQLAMSNAWCVLLHEPMRKASKELEKQEKDLHTELLRTEVLRTLIKDSTSECPACLQTVPPGARRRIEDTLQPHNETDYKEKESNLSRVRRSLAALRDFTELGQRDTLRLLWNTVEESTIDAVSAKGQRDEISKSLEDVNEEVLRKTKSDYEIAIREIDALERGIIKTREALDKNGSDSQRIQSRLDQLGQGNLVIQRRRRKIYTNLHKLFDEAVGAYREQLRAKVESDATRHFRALTTEADYACLRINESYGLMIVHKDGSEIPVRSAGAEHIVALCLMGALQNNAPLQGPIIIDSPFGRLDSGHTRNIIRALPSMARQVVLLVYENELPPGLARNELKSKLLAEWRLERRSARHTELVPRTD